MNRTTKQEILTNLLAVFTAISLYALPVQSFAAGDICQPIYGGGETCIKSQKLLLNKTVLNPQNNQYVDNLGVNDPKFAPSQEVPFRIIITNTSTEALSNIMVKDTLPAHISYVSKSGPLDDNNLSMTISKLNPNESKTIDFKGKIDAADKLPSDQGIVCVTNQAAATSGNQSANDGAQFCIQKQILAGETVPITKGGKEVFPPTQVSTTPPTGPEAISLLALVPAGLVGFVLRKRSVRSGQ